MIKQIAVAVVLTCAPAAFGQTYIVADGDCGPITLQLTEGIDFPNLAGSVAVDRVNNVNVYRLKEKVAVTPSAGPRSLDFTTSVPADALVIAAADLQPTVSGNETRTEHPKTLIRCGGTGRGSWRRSAGLRLEIYPQWNEGQALKPGHSMRFIAVDKAINKPVPDVTMELYRAGSGYLGTGEADQYGGVKFPETAAGRYLVTATYRRADPERPEHWLVDSSTLTFEIK
jgi:hypothetical protein